MKRIAVRPKYESRAKLEGGGLGICTKASAAGWVPRYFSNGEPGIWVRSVRVMAVRNSRKSCPVRDGKLLAEWATISVWTRSARWKRIAQPRGSALGSLSGITGIPVELEKRTVAGVDGRLKCGALLSVAASAVGVKVPCSMIPFA